MNWDLKDRAGTYICGRSTELLDNDFLHILDFLVKHVGILTLRDTITEVIDVLRSLTLTNFANPLLEQRNDHALNVVASDHLNAVTVGLNSSSISAAVLIKGHSDSSHRSLWATRRRMRDIGTWGVLA